MKIFDTLSKEKKEVNALDKKTIKIYTCGPTVYDYAHIGNLRTYIAEDIMKRVLLRKRKVMHVMNITDVGHLTSDADEGEDKMEVGAKRESKPAWDIAEFYTLEFLKDMKELKIKMPDEICKATDNIKEMIDLIKSLEEKGLTYKTKDGIYFDTSKFENYGEMTNLQKEGIKAGARVEIRDKKNDTDFALWKFSVEKKRDMEWKSPWSDRGFPGWHIECSAMAMKYLGPTLDLHAGGIDHVPIHHTNEIAQSEGSTGKTFSDVWMHVEFMMINGEKISKSKKNYFTLGDLHERGFSSSAFRYLCASSHYRSQINFTLDALKDSQNALDNINDFYSRMKDINNDTGEDFTNEINELTTNFFDALEDDLNTPTALAELFELIHFINKNSERLTKKNAGNIIKFLEDADSVFSFLEEEKEITGEESNLIQEREKLRKEGKFDEADKLRKELEELGVIIEDNPKGTKWKKR